MARMIPDIEPSKVHYPGERLVYTWLRDKLPKKYIVFHSLRVVEKSYSKSLQREADFVVLHPELGLLVIEVKGGTGIERSGGQWLRRGQALDPQPDFQGERAMHAIIGWLRARGLEAGLPYSFAIVFPEVVLTGSEPPGLDPAQVMDRRMSTEVEETVEAAYNVLSRRTMALPHDRLQKLEHALSGLMSSFVPLGAVMDDVVQHQWILDGAQLCALKMLVKGKERMLVEGGAGTGKTELALVGALERARQGQRVLLTCFNAALSAWLQERVAAAEELHGCRERIEVRHIHGLASDLAGLAGRRYAHDTAVVSGILIDASLDALAPSYDAIIVDEAQDFDNEWLQALQEFLTGDLGGMAVFCDRRQRLFDVSGVAETLELGDPIELEVNYRNTKMIATACQKVMPGAPPPAEVCPVGQVLAVSKVAADKQAHAVVELVRDLLRNQTVDPSRLVLLTPYSDRGSLGQVGRIEGIPLTSDAAAWRKGDRILVTTARAFKGLEADVVVLFDIGSLQTMAFTRSDLYVAASRARGHLIVVAQDDDVPQALAGA